MDVVVHWTRSLRRGRFGTRSKRGHRSSLDEVA
ncbi:hypothetical protein Taro_008191, partial [Colocasia esculenta]|nr:hypothetical protein [Colocasia esculenta]